MSQRWMKRALRVGVGSNQEDEEQVKRTALVSGALRGAGRQLRRAEVQTDLTQIVKTTIATVVAWLIAGPLFQLDASFLAPWAALLTVHATIYRSVMRGGQSVLATGLGLVLAFGVVQLVGSGAWGLGLAVLIGLLASRGRLLRLEGIAVATTSLFVITSGGAGDPMLLGERLLDVAIGIGVGVLVNLVVLPPLDDQSAKEQLDAVNHRLGGLMVQMAAQIGDESESEATDDWIEETRSIDRQLDRGEWLIDYSREAQWWNPRRRRSWRAADLERDRDLLVRLEEGVAQTRSLARTLSHSVASAEEWDRRFRDPWLDLLTRTGQAIADPHEEVHSLRDELDELSKKLSDTDLPGLRWSLYGSLITSLLHIVEVVDDVASSEPDLPEELAESSS